MTEIKSVQTIIIAMTIGIVAILAFVQTDKWLKQQAVDSCMQTNQLTTTYSQEDRNAVTIEPIVTAYKKCMQDKGYEL